MLQYLYCLIWTQSSGTTQTLSNAARNTYIYFSPPTSPRHPLPRALDVFMLWPAAPLFRSLPFSGSVKRTEMAQGVAEAKPLTRHSTSAEHSKPPVHHLTGFRDEHGWHSTGEKKQNSAPCCDSSFLFCLSAYLCISTPLWFLSLLHFSSSEPAAVETSGWETPTPVYSL